VTQGSELQNSLHTHTQKWWPTQRSTLQTHSKRFVGHRISWRLQMCFFQKNNRFRNGFVIIKNGLLHTFEKFSVK